MIGNLFIVFLLSFFLIFMIIYAVTERRRKIDTRLSKITLNLNNDINQDEEDKDNFLKHFYKKYEPLFLQANFKIKYDEFKKLIISLFILYVLIILFILVNFNFFSGLIVLIILSILFYNFPKIYLNYQRQKRMIELNKQKNDILTILMSSSYSQLPLDKTFKLISERLPNPASEIFDTAYKMLTANYDVSVVLDYIMKNFDSSDFNFLLSSYQIWLKYSGSLQSTYRIVTNTLRDKEEIEMEVKRQTDYANMFMFILVAIIVFMTMLIYAALGDVFIMYIKSTLGQISMILVVFFIFLGVFLINKTKNSIKY